MGDGNGKGDAFAGGRKAHVLIELVHHVILDLLGHDEPEDFLVGLDGDLVEFLRLRIGRAAAADDGAAFGAGPAGDFHRLDGEAGVDDAEDEFVFLGIHCLMVRLSLLRKP